MVKKRGKYAPKQENIKKLFAFFKIEQQKESKSVTYKNNNE